MPCPGPKKIAGLQIQQPLPISSLGVKSRAFNAWGLGGGGCQGGPESSMAAELCPHPGVLLPPSFTSRPPLFSPSCRAGAGYVLGVLLPHSHPQSPGDMGPTFLPGSLRSISVFMLEPLRGAMLDPPPAPLWRVASGAMEASQTHGRPAPWIEFLPPCLNKSRVAKGLGSNGSPSLPALPAWPLL